MRSIVSRLRILGVALVALVGLLGVGALPAQAATPQTAASTAAASTNWNIYTTFWSDDGQDVPLRYGDHSFGYVHIQDKHPMPDSSMIGWIDETLDGGTYTDQGDTIRVEEPLVTGNKFIVVYTERVDGASGDGRPVGIITAYQT